MADSSFESPRDNNDDDILELNNDLERMIENMEQISVQLTWMAYDMVVLRTNPKLAASVHRLQEAYQRCRAVVCGDKEPKMDPNP